MHDEVPFLCQFILTSERNYVILIIPVRSTQHFRKFHKRRFNRARMSNNFSIVALTLLDLTFRKLPSELTRGLVENWLSLEELGRIDSACCARDSRELFLSAIAMKYKIGASAMLNGKHAHRFIQWSVSRKILYHCKKLVPIRKAATSGVCEPVDYLDLAFERNRNLIFSNDVVCIHIASMVLSVMSSDSAKDWKACITREVFCRMLELLQHVDDNIVLRTLCTGESYCTFIAVNTRYASQCKPFSYVFSGKFYWKRGRANPDGTRIQLFAYLGALTGPLGPQHLHQCRLGRGQLYLRCHCTYSGSF